MAYGIWVVEWPNQNSQRAYPLSELASRTDQSGDFTIPNDFLLSLYLPINAALAVTSDKFYLQQLVVFSSGFSITIGYNDGSAYPAVARAVIPRSAHVENNSYRLLGIGDFEDIIGQVQIGQLASIDEQPAGQFTFDFDGGRLDAFVVQPTLRGVTSLRLRNGSTYSDRLFGDIEFAAGDNIQLQISGDNEIRIDAVDGSSLNERCECLGDDVTAPPIRTINSVPPTPAGDFQLIPGECVEITSVTNGLLLKDTCSAPCCGCTELESITSQMESFGDNVRVLENFANRLQVEVTQMSQVVLGSRLSDQGCLSCE